MTAHAASASSQLKVPDAPGKKTGWAVVGLGYLAINEILPAFAKCLHRLGEGEEVILITWLHEAQRSVMKVHPGNDMNNPLTGVFATRSPDRPNPLGLHRVKIVEMDGLRLRVGPIEAIDGTPVVDIKPMLTKSCDE